MSCSLKLLLSVLSIILTIVPISESSVCSKATTGSFEAFNSCDCPGAITSRTCVISLYACNIFLCDLLYQPVFFSCDLKGLICSLLNTDSNAVDLLSINKPTVSFSPVVDSSL